jgi:hypothetical protein
MASTRSAAAVFSAALHRLRPTLLLAAALLLAARGEAAAQQDVQPDRAVVVYTVSATFPAAESGAATQAALVERLARDPRLASLTVEKPDNTIQARVVARFVFERQADFQRWMSGDGGRGVTEALRQAQTRTGYQLEYRRFPVAELLRLTN